MSVGTTDRPDLGNVQTEINKLVNLLRRIEDEWHDGGHLTIGTVADIRDALEIHEE